MPEGSCLCTIYVVGLYPNITRYNGLKALRNALFIDESTEGLMMLAECVFKNNIFEHNEQLQWTATGTKMAPSYPIIFMAALEDGFLQSLSKKANGLVALY